MTDAAARRINDQLQSRGSGIGLRIGVRKTGCSGYSYVLDYADEVREGDTVFEDRGVSVVVDATSLPLIDGLQLDFRRDGLNEVFAFNNPNAEELCGCGESFSLPEEAAKS